MNYLNLISLGLWLLAAVANALQWTIKLRYEQSIFNRPGFWQEYFGPEASDLKYAADKNFMKNYALPRHDRLYAAPDTWYYRIFKLKYKERFPLSATALAWTTDGFHLVQHIRTALIISCILTFVWQINTWSEGFQVFFAYAGLWGMTFEVFYSKIFLKRDPGSVKLKLESKPR